MVQVHDMTVSTITLTLLGLATSHAVVQAQTTADTIVMQLRELPTPVPAPPPDGGIRPIEQRRGELYQQLLRLEADAMPALSRGLRDRDVQLRRNVALALNVLAGGWFDLSWPKVNIRPCLPALVAALRDSDGSVRWWSAQAIGDIGPNAAEAVPALIVLLKSPDEGDRNSAAIALKGIGRGAENALPALREALSDPSEKVRGFAAAAIEKIDAH
jgi:HEAT repeat protein